MKKSQNLLMNVFTSGIKTDDIALKYRLIVLNTCLLVGAISLGTFFIVWYIAGNYFLATIDILVSALFWVAFFSLRKTQDSQTIILLSSLMIIVAAIAFLVENKNINFGLSWIYVVPVYIMFLMGHKKGLILTLIYYFFVAAEIYIHQDIWIAQGLNWVFLSRLIITTSIIILISFVSEFSFSKINEKIYELSITDSLTNVYNRRNFDSILDKELKRQNRTKLPLCLCMLDVDNFKKLNDTLGHLQGDLVLKEVASIIKNTIRKTDEIGRWGGEEFCIILPNTSLSSAATLIERVRNNIANFDFSLSSKITCSFGIAQANECENADSLIKKADTAMYCAKNTGKNKICY